MKEGGGEGKEGIPDAPATIVMLLLTVDILPSRSNLGGCQARCHRNS